MVELARAVVTLGLLVGARFRPLVRVLARRLLLWRFGVWLHLSVRLELPLQSGVEPVLDVVVGPARKILGDLVNTSSSWQLGDVTPPYRGTKCIIPICCP